MPGELLQLLPPEELLPASTPDDATWVALGFHRAEGVGALILDREERLDGKPAAPFVPLGREAYVRARVGSTLTGKVEEIGG